jgi:hypothetical protein
MRRADVLAPCTALLGRSLVIADEAHVEFSLPAHPYRWTY